ncbi:MAG: pyridoxamine 5'-phosphate oxidase family protein [Bacillota bacterium]
MQTMTEEIKDVLRSNVGYLATSSPYGKPNVVPVGLVEPISDDEVLLVDVRFNKTRTNLENNREVALAVSDLSKLQAYQLKGKAEVFASGEMFEKVKEIMAQRAVRKRVLMEKRLEETQDPDLKKKLLERMQKHGKLRAKAAVLVKISEIYSTM